MSDVNNKQVTVPAHSLRILLRFVLPAADAGALTAVQLIAFERLAAAAGWEQETREVMGSEERR